MSDELQYYGNPSNDSGLSITAKIYNNYGAQIGGDISCAEVGTLAIYIGNMPTAIAGFYTVRFFSGSDFLSHGVLEWDGEAEIFRSTIDSSVNIAAIKERTDGLPNDPANQTSVLAAINASQEAADLSL